VQRSVLPGAGTSPLAQVRHIVAVGSAKGGVGKSTVSVNLALGLAGLGARVGLLDADIYGPSLPLLLDVHDLPQMDPQGLLVPVVGHGLQLMSLGLVAGDGAPVIWRGPLLAQTLQRFLRQVRWGELDHLVVDLPPGTGDVVLTLCQTVELAGAVMVTTPQDVALQDVERGIAMFRKLEVDVLGLVENMSYLICPHCGARHEVFGHGGGRETAVRLGLDFLGQIPLDPQLRASGDAGRPVLLGAPDSVPGRAFADLARRVAAAIERLDTAD
jgi:ATP-binding protein involved in chromosome partitioning